MNAPSAKSGPSKRRLSAVNVSPVSASASISAASVVPVEVLRVVQLHRRQPRHAGNGAQQIQRGGAAIRRSGRGTSSGEWRSGTGSGSIGMRAPHVDQSFMLFLQGEEFGD